LISGGLDSMLAAKTILEQGVRVEGINFFTGFCVEGHTHAIRAKDKAKPKRNNSLWVAEQLGIKLHIIDVIEEYKDVLINPKHGYGANMNPCLDCKIFMVNKAKQWIAENGFDFIITGEVIGQRPMSQRKETMPIVARESGADDLLLRPLCAKNLPPTLPEREGWVDREKLHDFSGRSRKPQMALAEHYGFSEYAQPAGGCCFLTDASYSAKLVDLWQARDNNKEFMTMSSTSHSGPLVLIDGSPSDEDLQLAAAITARYGQGREADRVDVSITDKDCSTRTVQVKPLPADQIPEAWFI
jgi:tRNA-uridine 2-sulfurtransferase